MLMFLASVLDQMDLALEHIQKGSVHDARFGLAAGMSGFRNGPEIPKRPNWGAKLTGHLALFDDNPIYGR